MPLFMDYHKGSGASVGDMKKAHVADESVQRKYGVVYHQFWTNEQDGTVFCLMEGPDKEACAAAHREVYGDVACSIVEVSAGFYKLLIGTDHALQQTGVAKIDGTLRSSMHSVMGINIEAVTCTQESRNYKTLKNPYGARELALFTICQFKGRHAKWLDDDSLMVVFDNSAQAVGCAIKLQSELLRRRSSEVDDEWNIKFKIGLSAGQALIETCSFFSEATTLVRRLCSVASPNEVLISADVEEFCNVRELARGVASVRILSPREESFLANVFTISEQRLSDERFTIDCLSRNIGVSRPQLYRKMVSLTGRSPHDFIRDLRMEKALRLLRQRAGNISEVALEVGYNNPSYFAHCFQLRFGCTPSKALL